jgi:hypothetical protein
MRHEPDGHVLLAQTFKLYLCKLELPADIYSDTKLSSIHAERELTPWLPNTYLIVILSRRVRYLNVYLV